MTDKKENRCGECTTCPGRKHSKKWLEWYNYPNYNLKWEVLEK